MDALTTVVNCFAESINKLLTALERIEHDVFPSDRINVKTGERKTPRTWL